ncbi:hypothetical protein AX774_g8206 [Zancudomyces culisetae]|uniref:Uncharacterized protein n=1 Tax=Zancudomyces culisetae TaxID=1213189 RepID=A0A1R1PBR1_ZANCU|nr:hypothetical protein AX774_g8206 [Zancudomyces culisetae]|eukprot:OMH78406.1 hypothetical protein AX774_g8206 [Zancudomyces culisetae]
MFFKKSPKNRAKGEEQTIETNSKQIKVANLKGIARVENGGLASHAIEDEATFMDTNQKNYPQDGPLESPSVEKKGLVNGFGFKFKGILKKKSSTQLPKTISAKKELEDSIGTVTSNTATNLKINVVDMVEYGAGDQDSDRSETDRDSSIRDTIKDTESASIASPISVLSEEYYKVDNEATRKVFEQSGFYLNVQFECEKSKPKPVELPKLDLSELVLKTELEEEDEDEDDFSANLIKKIEEAQKIATKPKLKLKSTTGEPEPKEKLVPNFLGKPGVPIFSYQDKPKNLNLPSWALTHQSVKISTPINKMNTTHNITLKSRGPHGIFRDDSAFFISPDAYDGYCINKQTPMLDTGANRSLLESSRMY